MMVRPMLHGTTPAIEECDAVARQILGGLGHELLLVGITSVSHGDGTSLAARGVSTVLAGNYQTRTLLIRLDKGPQASASSPGLIDVLANEASLGESIKRTTDVPYAVMDCGGPNKTSSMLLAGLTMDRCCAAIAEAFDVVIFDCRPPGDGPEVLILARRLIQLYLVLRAGCVTLTEAEKACTMLENAGACISGVILNNVSRRRKA